MRKLTQEIVSDAEVTRVHANANFGQMTPREVVDQGVLTYAFGFTSGHTQLTILREHGLLKGTSGYQAALSKKGFEYLRAMFFAVPLTKIMQLRSAEGDEG